MSEILIPEQGGKQQEVDLVALGARCHALACIGRQLTREEAEVLGVSELATADDLQSKGDAFFRDAGLIILDQVVPEGSPATPSRYY